MAYVVWLPGDPWGLPPATLWLTQWSSFCSRHPVSGHSRSSQCSL